MSDSNSEKINVILADNHPLTLRGLENLLAAEADICVLKTVTDGMQLIEAVQQHIGQVGVVVMDFHLPLADGRACLEYIRWQRWPVKVVLLAEPNDTGIVRQALEYEADALISKLSPLEQVLAVLRQVAAGQMVFPQSARRWIRPVESPLADLTEREEDVLALAAAGLTNPKIADELTLSENTIKTHLKNIFEKLGVSNRTEASRIYHRYSR